MSHFDGRNEIAADAYDRLLDCETECWQSLSVRTESVERLQIKELQKLHCRVGASRMGLGLKRTLNRSSIESCLSHCHNNTREYFDHTFAIAFAPSRQIGPHLTSPRKTYWPSQQRDFPSSHRRRSRCSVRLRYRSCCKIDVGRTNSGNSISLDNFTARLRPGTHRREPSGPIHMRHAFFDLVTFVLLRHRNTNKALDTFIAVSPVLSVRSRQMPTLTSLDHSSRQADYLNSQPRNNIAAEQLSGLQFGVLLPSRRTGEGCEVAKRFDNSCLGKHNDGGPEVYLPVKRIPRFDLQHEPTAGWQPVVAHNGSQFDCEIRRFEATDWLISNDQGSLPQIARAILGIIATRIRSGASEIMMRPVRHVWSRSVSYHTKLTPIDRPFGDEPRRTIPPSHSDQLALLQSIGKARFSLILRFRGSAVAL